MLQVAVCDDEVIECCNMAKKIKETMEEMKIPCIIRQFQSGGELLQALESFDIIFLDIMMQGLDGMKTAQLFRKKSSDKILIFVSSSREYGFLFIMPYIIFQTYDENGSRAIFKQMGNWGGRLRQRLCRPIVRIFSVSAYGAFFLWQAKNVVLFVGVPAHHDCDRV